MTGEMFSRTGATSTASESTHLQPPPTVNRAHPLLLRADDIEIQVIGANANAPQQAQGADGKATKSVCQLCCAPCIWLRASSTVHKMAITTATLLVTSLLVASPILFLISAAPSQIQRDCYAKDDDDCMPTQTPPPECVHTICKETANSIQARMNWKEEPCEDFKAYSCSTVDGGLHFMRSAQESADLEMQQLLSLNTSYGPFRKLGRLYGSCLRQTFNSSTIRILLDKLGGYLPIGALGPSIIAPLVNKINEIGPIPLLEIYFDLSYGKKPQILLIIDRPNGSPRILENPYRWMGPKAPQMTLRNEIPEMLDTLLATFLPPGLGVEQRNSEINAVHKFVKELFQIRKNSVQKDFSNSYAIDNVTTLSNRYPFLDWEELLPSNWTGPLILRSATYLNNIRTLLLSHENRIIHNSLLLLFALNALPPGPISHLVCTKATIWAVPDAASALYVTQYSEETVENALVRAEKVFESMKAHLKRSPTLKSAPLVRLSQLKIQSNLWPTFFNTTEVMKSLDRIDVSSDDWFENILKIYQARRKLICMSSFNLTVGNRKAWAYPTVAKPFYDPLSHAIVVPLSLLMVPYFNPVLPLYIQYATVGVTLGKEILRSVTVAFQRKAMLCVPPAVEIFSNTSRMDFLIHSGAMQIAYHSMLSLTGPNKGMERLPGFSLPATQTFFIVTAQELCSEAAYDGVDVLSEDFSDILQWLMSQGMLAKNVFQCSSNSAMNALKNCDLS